MSVADILADCFARAGAQLVMPLMVTVAMGPRLYFINLATHTLRHTALAVSHAHAISSCAWRRVWAERLRFWLRDQVLATLLEKMHSASTGAQRLQAQTALAFTVPTLPPESGKFEDLQLPDDESLTRTLLAMKAQVRDQKQKGPAGGGGLFGGAPSEQQKQQHAVQVSQMQDACQVHIHRMLEILVDCTQCMSLRGPAHHVPGFAM